jgi:predicted RNase H-like HicB family nuclease
VSKMPLERYTVLLERSGDEYSVYVPALPGCTSGGGTQGEAIENVKEAIRLTLEYRRELGLPFAQNW